MELLFLWTMVDHRRDGLCRKTEVVGRDGVVCCCASAVV